MKVIIRVSIGDLMLRNSEIDSLVVVQELGQHTTCQIEFTRDSAGDVTLEQLLRDPVSVKVQGEGGPVVEIFQGYIGDGRQSHLLHVGSRFQLLATSASERLDFVDTVYFPQSTLGSIASAFNVNIVGAIRRERPPFDYVQWRESEFAFLKRLADEHGGFLVTHGAEPEIRMQFADTQLELLWGHDLLEVVTRARPVNHGLTGASYDMKQKSTHGHAGVRHSPVGLGGAARLVSSVAELAGEGSGGGDPGVYQPTGRETTHAELKTALRRESERLLGGAVLIEGGSVNTRVAAGDLVTLVSGVNYILTTGGKLGVIKVVHSFADQHYSNAFVATPWSGYTALEPLVGPSLPGPVTAEVVETAGDPLQMGRVRLAYRWQGDGSSTNWARLATPHAGNGRGMLWLPEVGDEVLVVFEGGDPERPIVIGSLWNGRDQAPEAAKDNTAKRLVTRSGNTIQLLDDASGETIEVFTASGKTLLQMTNANGHPVITIHSEGDIALQAKEEIRLICKNLVQKVEVDAVRKVGGDDVVEAGKNALLKAGMDATVSGLNTGIKASVNLDAVAGAMNNIVGTLVNIQPPGFVPKPVVSKPVTARPTQVADRQTPGEATPQRTSDPDTPRT